MPQRISTWLVIFILGFMPLFGAPNSVLAESDLGFPASIAVESLASGEVPAAVTAPGSITLDRITLPTKTGLPVRQIATIEILYVENGTLTVADGLGLSSPLPAEKSVHLRAGSSYTAINDGDSDVTYLRLSFTAAITAATPIVASSTQESTNAAVTSLAVFDLATIPKSPATLFLNRATWESGADTGSYTQNGPIGMYTESGMLTITSPSGIDGQLGEGKSVLLPADQVLRTRNDSNDDAVVLLFGVIPSDGSAVTTESTDAVKEPATDGEMATDTSSGATGVLYQADATTRFEDWTHAGGWVTVGGMLVNDGSSDKSVFLPAPFQAPVTDYAVEVEMQWVRGGSTFGIVARGDKETGYWIGSKQCQGRPGSLTSWAGPPEFRCRYDEHNLILATDMTLNTDWHTYRVEVQGNVLRVFVDGTKVIETTDNRFLTSGQVGVWSDGAQVNIRRFTISALGDGD